MRHIRSHKHRTLCPEPVDRSSGDNMIDPSEFGVKLQSKIRKVLILAVSELRINGANRVDVESKI